MSLVDEIQALTKQQPPSRCGTCNWFTQLTPDEQKEFDAYLQLIRAGQGHYYYASLHKVCSNHGLRTNEKSFREHCHNHHDKLFSK